MKKILLLSLSAFAAMGLSSCMNGDYDANPLTVNSGTNPLNTGGGGGGGGGGGSSFSWTGNEPMSAKIDGIDFLANTGSVSFTHVTGGGANYDAVQGTGPTGVM